MAMSTIKEIQRLNDEELRRGIALEASWHWQYRSSSWVYVGGLYNQLSVGDVIAVFSQWGEIEDAHLVTDDETGQSKGFAFLKYEDFRSAVLAVDNMNGARLLNRMLRVDHKLDYTPPKPKDGASADGGAAAAGTEEGYTPGAAYRDQELANGFSLQQGVDVFGRAAAATGSEGVAVPLSSLVGAHGRLATAGPRSGVDWRAGGSTAASAAEPPRRQAAGDPLHLPTPAARTGDERGSHRRKRPRSDEASEVDGSSHRRHHRRHRRHHRSSSGVDGDKAGTDSIDGRDSPRGGDGQSETGTEGRRHRARGHRSGGSSPGSSSRERRAAGEPSSSAGDASGSRHSRRRHRHERAGRVKHRGAMPEDLEAAAEAAARASAAACSSAAPGLDRAD